MGHTTEAMYLGAVVKLDVANVGEELDLHRWALIESVAVRDRVLKPHVGEGCLGNVDHSLADCTVCPNVVKGRSGREGHGARVHSGHQHH